MSVRHRVTYSIQRLAIGSALLCMMVSPIAAQNAAQATETTGFDRIALMAGRSTVLNTPFDVTRFAVTNPAIADAVVVSPREVLIDGKSAGTVSLIVWGANEHRQYDVVIDVPGQRLYTVEAIRSTKRTEEAVR